MTHAYSVRIPLFGSTPPPKVNFSRLTRMQEKGWSIAHPVPGVDVALCGAAALHQTPEWVVVGMAFLQDRAAVQNSLGITPTQADSKTDLELVLDLRVKQGEQWLKDTYGSFSLVFIHRQTGAFEAHRDHFGIYPFYYTVSEGALTCASDLRACLHLSGSEIVSNPLRIADFIQGRDIDLDQTVFESVFRLPPAHSLLPAPEGATTRQYWQLTLPRAFVGDNAASNLHTALTQATKACLNAPGNVGTMLSGGLDSSSLTGLAAANSPEPVQTLSFVYGAEKSYDESAYIDSANAAFKTLSHKIPVTGAMSLDDIGPLLEEQMDLFLAPGLQKSRQIYAEAHALGLDALIDGHGGDEAISHGYGRLVELAAARQFRTLYREAYGAAQVHGVPLLALVSGHIARFSGLRPGHPARRVLMKISRLLSRNSHVADWPERNVTALIAPQVRAQFDPKDRYKSTSALKPDDDLHEAERITHLAALTDTIMNHSLEVLHRSATAAGILPRYPFFDHRVISLCLSLPADFKLRDGRSRWILREAMRGVLPDKIRLRSDKAEFGNEVQEAIMAYFRDKDTDQFAALSDFVDTDAALQLRNQVLSGQIKYVSAIRALWRMAVLTQWVAACEQWRIAQAKGMLI